MRSLRPRLSFVLFGALFGALFGLLGAAPIAAQDAFEVPSDLTAPPSAGRLVTGGSPQGRGLGPRGPADSQPPIEGALALSDPHLHYPASPLPAPDRGLDDRAQDDPEEPWSGPAVELGYTHFQLPDGFSGGAVHAGSFGGYLPTGPVRVGGRAEIGSRGYSLGNGDIMVRGSVLAGYQHLGWRPLTPYIAATVSAGALFGQRFSTPESWGFGGAGVEVGADLVLVRNLWIGLSLGYERVSMAGLGVDLWVFRLRLGL